MNAVVFHHDDNVNYCCESMGLIIARRELDASDGTQSRLAPEKLTVLVSPSNYFNRKHFCDGYGCNVFPLMFKWQELTADHIKKIFGVEESGNFCCSYCCLY
jgi:hypothetical protein